MSAADYSRLLGEFQRGFHESIDTRAYVEIRSPGRFYRGREPSELDTVNYETEAVIASVAVPYSVGNDASTHAVAVTTREYWQPPELLETFKQSCSEAGAILPLAIRSRLALDWEISRNPIACWMSLLTWLHGFTVRDPDGRYQEHHLITNSWQASADAIEYLRLNTDSPGWPEDQPDDPKLTDYDATIDEKAVTLKVAHPEWTDQQIADNVPCHVKTLYKPNMVKFRQAKEALATGREKYRHGSRPDRRRRPSNLDGRDRDE
jgi:hypothetical protein